MSCTMWFILVSHSLIFIFICLSLFNGIVFFLFGCRGYIESRVLDYIIPANLSQSNALQFLELGFKVPAFYLPLPAGHHCQWNFLAMRLILKSDLNFLVCLKQHPIWMVPDVRSLPIISINFTTLKIRELAGLGWLPILVEIVYGKLWTGKWKHINCVGCFAGVKWPCHRGVGWLCQKLIGWGC